MKANNQLLKQIKEKAEFIENMEKEILNLKESFEVNNKELIDKKNKMDKQILLQNQRIGEKNNEIDILKKNNESVRVSLSVKETLVEAKAKEILNLKKRK